MLFIGDSLIEFADWNSLLPGRRINNLGLAGETVEGMLARLDRAVRPQPQPDLIMTMTGTNNLAMEDYGFVGNYEQIIHQLNQWFPETPVVIAGLLPISLFWLAPDAVPRMNQQLRQMAARQQAVFLDLFPLFLDTKQHPRSSYFLEDGVHLSQAGYRAWAEALARLISGLQGQNSASGQASR